MQGSQGCQPLARHGTGCKTRSDLARQIWTGNSPSPITDRNWQLQACGRGVDLLCTPMGRASPVTQMTEGGMNSSLVASASIAYLRHCAAAGNALFACGLALIHLCPTMATRLRSSLRSAFGTSSLGLTRNEYPHGSLANNWPALSTPDRQSEGGRRGPGCQVDAKLPGPGDLLGHRAEAKSATQLFKKRCRLR